MIVMRIVNWWRYIKLFSNLNPNCFKYFSRVSGLILAEIFTIGTMKLSFSDKKIFENAVSPIFDVISLWFYVLPDQLRDSTAIMVEFLFLFHLNNYYIFTTVLLPCYNNNKNALNQNYHR